VKREFNGIPVEMIRLDDDYEPKNTVLKVA